MPARRGFKCAWQLSPQNSDVTAETGDVYRYIAEVRDRVMVMGIDRAGVVRTRYELPLFSYASILENGGAIGGGRDGTRVAFRLNARGESQPMPSCLTGTNVRQVLGDNGDFWGIALSDRSFSVCRQQSNGLVQGPQSFSIAAPHDLRAEDDTLSALVSQNSEARQVRLKFSSTGQLELLQAPIIPYPQVSLYTPWGLLHVQRPRTRDATGAFRSQVQLENQALASDPVPFADVFADGFE
jgi:hypothetical protein